MKLAQMFPAKFVRGQDLSAPILAIITAITREETHPRPGVTEEKYVIHFERVDPKTGEYIELPANLRTAQGYGAILRHTLAEQIADALKSDDTDQWTGQRIVFMPIHTRAAGKDVLTISARAPKTNGQTTAQNHMTEAEAIATDEQQS